MLPEPVFKLSEVAETLPDILPAAVKLNELPLDELKVAAPVSVNVTLPVVIALKLPALVCTLIAPAPAERLKEEAVMLPLMSPLALMFTLLPAEPFAFTAPVPVRETSPEVLATIEDALLVK